MTRIRPARPSFVFVVPWELQVPGGVNEVIVNLHRQITAEGEFEPLILVNRWSTRRPVEEIVDGRRTVYFRMSSAWPDRSLVSFLKWLALSPIFFFDLWRLCRRERIAVINAHYPSLGMVGPALLRKLGIFRGHLLLSFHGLDLPRELDRKRIDRAAWTFILRQADAVIAVSHSFGDRAREFARGAAPVVVIHNGVDVVELRQRAKQQSNSLASLDGRDVILTVAKLEARKGVDVLVRAFAELHQDNPRLALVVVGGPGDSTATIRALIEELGLGADVFFFENVSHDDIGAFFERAKVVCLASRSETFGIVLLEAGVFSRPVVATRVGGIPEVIEHGVSGLLVEPDDASALAETLRRVLGDERLAASLGDHLERRVESEFTWRRSYAAYKALLRAPNRTGRS